MKTGISILLLLACYIQSYAGVDYNMIPYRQGKKWGYCDSTRKVMIQPRFDEAGVFYGPLTTVKLDSYYCVINHSGEILYQTKCFVVVTDNGTRFYGSQHCISEQIFDLNGKPLVKEYYKIQRAQYGYYHITTSGEGLMDSLLHEVLPPKYGSVDFFSKSLVRVYDKDKKCYGLVDLNTGRQYATDYSMIYAPKDGMMMVCKENRYGFINMKGDMVIPVQYNKECPEDVQRGTPYFEHGYEGYNTDGFYSGLAILVNEDGEAGYIDKKGKTVIPFQFDKAFGFKGNFAWVKKDGKWGMINKQGKYVLQPVYQHPAYLSSKELMVLDGFHEGLVAVCKDSLYGYADTTGKVVIPFTFSRAAPFYQGLAAAYKGNLMGFIDRTGVFVIQPEYLWAEGVGVAYTDGTNITYADPFADGYAIALGADKRWTLIDKKGVRLIQQAFDESCTISFTDGMAEATADGKRYFFDEHGQIRYTFDGDNHVSSYGRDLFYSYRDKCYFNARTNIKYCD